MPIVVSRATGEIISKPNYTQEQINELFERMVRNWIRMYPEDLLKTEVPDNGKEVLTD